MCWEKDSAPSRHTSKYLYEVTTSSSKPSEVVITPVGRGAFFLPNHMTFVLELFRARLRGEKACCTLRKFCCRAFNTKSEWPAEYKTVSSAYKWMRELLLWIPPILMLILFTSSWGLRHRLSRLHWTGFIIINPGLSCLLTHSWFPFPLISMLYMCPLSLSVIVPMSVGGVSTYALVQLLCCVLYILCITGIVPYRSMRFTLALLFGYSPVFLYTCLFWVY